MAEAIAAVAIAGNVLQFLDVEGKFASKAFDTCFNRTARNGPSNLEEFVHISSDLEGLLEKLQNPTQDSQRPPSQQLTSVAASCSEVI
jgi:hypothetical protein